MLVGILPAPLAKVGAIPLGQDCPSHCFAWARRPSRKKAMLKQAAHGFVWLNLLVALATVIGSGLLFSGVQNLPPLDYNRLSTQLGIACVRFGIGASLSHLSREV
ncbi:MAG: hypothetical protein N2651_04015 [Fimbriimonadales bacterium]|nr:hypothetical protein [Fimbriimonadales bacterium]